jgi:NADPH:quinone reductase-like Zn-dependent oxidoreductase
MPNPMHAVVQDAYGEDPEASLRYASVPRPAIGADQVLVHVAAASIDRGTWHLLTGQPQLMRLMGYGFRRPKASNPGRAFAGTIAATGADVRDLSVGDEVYGSSDSAFAEYVAADAKLVARKPANLSFEQAAAAPISAVTALQAVRDAQIEAGQRVLVIGATGGVGSFIVQIARAAGGEVTAVASTRNLELARQLGAVEVIDYTRTDITDATRPYDAILDTGGSRPVSELRRVLAPHGTLVLVGGESSGRWLGGFARNLKMLARAPFVRGQRLRSLASKENAADLDELRTLFEAGSVIPVVDRVYPLSETAGAIRRLMDGGVAGKIIVTP